jgi:hypothetical protein
MKTPYRTAAERPEQKEEVPMDDNTFHIKMTKTIGVLLLAAVAVIAGTTIVDTRHDNLSKIQISANEAEKARNESFKSLWDHTIPPQPAKEQK